MIATISPTPRPPSSKRVVPRPFIKWVGGKGQLLEQLWPMLPSTCSAYHEPFMGGGALFFALRPGQASLSDVNSELVHCYQAVRDNVDGVITHLQTHPYDKDHYYRIRALHPMTLSLEARAARTIYLNRAGFNGLYRVNGQGVFNVPFGRYKNPLICHEENLRACSLELQNVALEVRDFEAVLDHAKPGELVYFDPPYVPISKTSDFTAYSAGGFGPEDQLRLAKVFTQLADRGVYCLLSNSDTTFVRQLYKDFEIDVVSASRNINSKGEKRGKISEVVVRSFPRRKPSQES